MALSAVFNPTPAVLTVFGDAADNSLTVSRDAAGNILVNAGAVAISNGTPTVANTARIEVLGDAGNDTIALSELNGALPAAILFGGLGNDIMTAGSGSDSLFGQDGNDTLLGKGGNDFLFGGAGNDTLTGGDGDDQMFGEDGNDRMIWNPGDDSDLMEGGNGDDTAEVNGGGGAEDFALTANGTRVRFDRTNPAPFTLDIGTTEHLVLNANGGTDTFTVTGDVAALITVTVDGGAGNDTIAGGNGADMLFGGADNDFLGGGAGNDTLEGGAGTDTLAGAGDDDTYVLGAEASGIDTVFDTAGIDTITTTINRSLAFADYSEIENLKLLPGAIAGTGNALQNTITGNDAANTLNGLTGVDHLIGGKGSDTYFVDSTIDQVTEAAGAAAGTADRVIFNGLAGQTYVLAANVERLTLAGSAATDGTANTLANIMVGNAAANTLDGRQGNDNVNGAAGNDTLIGGAGVDRLTGGAGHDFFVLNAPLSAANRDVVVDFSHVDDTFRLENAVMIALGGAGALNPNVFFAGPAADDGDDHIVYDLATGTLTYDSNGDAAGGTTLLATLLNKPVLTAGDFVVI